MGAKKKKGLANRLAKMTDEDRARYLQHRADMEEEARRRKEQLISMFLKNKLKKEEAFARLNVAKINQNWHQIMRRQKCKEMKDEVQCLKIQMERVLDLKNRTIKRLLQELDEADLQYGNNFQSHLNHITAMIDFGYKSLEEMHEVYEKDREEMLEEGRKERVEIIRKATEEEQYLKTVIYQTEEIARKELREHYEYYFKKSDDVIRQNKEEFEIMRKEKERNLGDLWRKIGEFLRAHVEVTDVKRAHLAELQTLDAESAAEIAKNEETIRRQEEEIAHLENKHESLKKSQSAKIDELTRDLRMTKGDFLDAKILLKKDLDNDERRFILLTETSNSTIRYLEKLETKGVKLLQLMQVCRKFETQEEKILRFSTWEDLEKYANVDDESGDDQNPRNGSFNGEYSLNNINNKKQGGRALLKTADDFTKLSKGNGEMKDDVNKNARKLSGSIQNFEATNKSIDKFEIVEGNDSKKEISNESNDELRDDRKASSNNSSLSSSINKSSPSLNASRNSKSSTSHLLSILNKSSNPQHEIARSPLFKQVDSRSLQDQKLAASCGKIASRALSAPTFPITAKLLRRGGKFQKLNLDEFRTQRKGKDPDEKDESVVLKPKAAKLKSQYNLGKKSKSLVLNVEGRREEARSLSAPLCVKKLSAKIDDSKICLAEKAMDLSENKKGGLKKVSVSFPSLRSNSREVIPTLRYSSAPLLNLRDNSCNYNLNIGSVISDLSNPVAINASYTKDSHHSSSSSLFNKSQHSSLSSCSINPPLLAQSSNLIERSPSSSNHSLKFACSVADSINPPLLTHSSNLIQKSPSSSNNSSNYAASEADSINLPVLSQSSNLIQQSPSSSNHSSNYAAFVADSINPPVLSQSSNLIQQSPSSSNHSLNVASSVAVSINPPLLSHSSNLIKNSSSSSNHSSNHMSSTADSINPPLLSHSSNLIQQSSSSSNHSSNYADSNPAQSNSSLSLHSNNSLRNSPTPHSNRSLRSEANSSSRQNDSSLVIPPLPHPSLHDNISQHFSSVATSPSKSQQSPTASNTPLTHSSSEDSSKPSSSSITTPENSNEENFAKNNSDHPDHPNGNSEVGVVEDCFSSVKHLEGLWGVYNKVLFDCVAMRRERKFLLEENERLKVVMRSILETAVLEKISSQLKEVEDIYVRDVHNDGGVYENYNVRVLN